MRVFYIQLANCNKYFVSGLSRNLFYIMIDIPIVVRFSVGGIFQVQDLYAVDYN